MHSSRAQLEADVFGQPNSIERNQALAEEYARQGRWQEAAKAYRTLASLYPATALLFINRIRLGATALMVSSGLLLLAAVVKPSVVDARTDPVGFAQAVSAPGFLWAEILFILAFVLYSCAAISVYKLLSYSRDHRPAFWGMVLSVIGVALSMPSLGIQAFVLPLIGRLYLEGETGGMAVYFAMQQSQGMFILGAGGWLLLAGTLCFSWAVLRNRSLSLRAFLLYLAGWIPYVTIGGRLSRTALLLPGALIALGGIGFARSMWIRASAQFDPTTDRPIS